MANKVGCVNHCDILTGFILILFFCLPYVILGPSAYITIHDFLDLTVAHLHNITNNKMFFSMDGTLPLMENVDRMSIAFSTPFELKSIIFYLLPTYWAIILNMFLVKLFAFVGMIHLLNMYVTPNFRLLNFSISTLFCLIPFYVDYGISSAGIPLITYALMNLYYDKKVVCSYVLVALYAFYSSFALSGFFVCFLLFSLIVVLWYKNKRIDYCLLFALIILSVFYVAANWNLLYGYLMPSELVSHRQEWIDNICLVDVCRTILGILAISQYHSGTFIAWPIVIGFVIIYLLYYNKYNELTLYLKCLVGLIMLIALGAFTKLLPSKFFASFQFDRFYFLYPAMCFILLAKMSVVLFEEKKKWILFTILFCSVGCVGANNIELVYKWFDIIHVKRLQPSYNQFYDEKLFDAICGDLGVKKDYSTKVVSVGMFPSVSEYNGFWCLDGYLNSYSLDYKHKFRKVIAKEINKDSMLKSYFDDWGSRCYVFSAELYNYGNQYFCSKEDDFYVNHLDINTKVLKDLGCQYIFSAVDIINYQELGLVYVDAYTTSNSYWNIRVYKLV